MSENTYDVAAATPETTASAKAAKPRRATGGGGGTGSGGGSAEPTEYTYSGGKLAFTDNPGQWTSDYNYGQILAKSTKWGSFMYDRKFTGTTTGSGERNTICLPFAMTSDQISAIFGSDAKIYEITSVDTKNLTVTGTPVTSTKANTPYVLELPSEKTGVSYTGSITTETTPDAMESSFTSGKFVGVFKYTKFNSKSNGTYDFYGYDADRNGMFNFFSDEGADFKPFRAYLEINKSAGSKPFYYFVIDEGGTTAIDSVSATTLTDDAPVYNLQGQLVRQAGQHTQLPQGLYIQKGRKFVQQ
jgi:hypothetical protein